MLKVPVGTQILAEDNETVIADLTKPGQRVVLCKGGDGGFGNTHFKTSTNQAPRRADPGWPGDGALDLAAPQADRRCRPGRPAQRRQVDLARRDLARQAEDRRLPVHHAQAAARRGARRRDGVRARRPARADRGRALRAAASATASSAMSSAAARSCTWSTARRTTWSSAYRTIRARARGLRPRPRRRSPRSSASTRCDALDAARDQEARRRRSRARRKRHLARRQGDGAVGAYRATACTDGAARRSSHVDARRAADAATESVA